MEYESVTHTTSDRCLGRLPSGSDVSVTVHRYVGGPGPAVYVQGAQHGIELNGPAALRRLHGRLIDAEIAGTVVVVPVVNPLAFDHRSYMTPAEYDVMNPNLNRVWPGDEAGSLQERLAARLWDLVTDADAAVDLHTGTADMLEHVRYQDGEGGARTLARAFGTEYLVVDSDEAPADDDFRGTFRTAAARADVPAITVELSNSRTVTHSAIDTGVVGVENVLRELGVLPDDPARPPDQTRLRNDGATTVAAESGLFELRPDLGVGDHVEAGETLGAVYSPSTFERLQTATADDGGVAYSLAREAVVVAGERIAGIATPV
ncbi:succinylglutamate desuccinylase/aspartoacylase family protein [Halomicroarcula sp. S1AR25-4]|uniref:succinylglutamate desuccinylase/aspartoacylase family protein n=1 Tax=Haloarcula sp. S1AR25-4 TaxID=2950538 RepID=UPI002874F410|nr:succinylglutamate desuccinylase/aspartoacylase family protein [Halomicroarcula sp. S1AR25-4]MDS0279588.1 succinylglutamate desuccinylase/aspartoacylase family protein [Halomicroarcula sp. S1AR25-4]